jgi:signal transduction histidine kinase
LNHAVPEQPIIADADLTLLEQAVSNLVDNAVQYNRDGGHVAVVLDRQDRGFALTVTDDGPGVPEAELGSLTSRRFRGTEARSRRPDGQGIGLSIVAEAADRLGFRLSFSRPESGGLMATIQSDSSSH